MPLLFLDSFFDFGVDQELSKMLKCITASDQSQHLLPFNSQILDRSVSVHLTLKAWRLLTVICLTHSSRRPFCIWIAVWIKALSKDCLVSGSRDMVAWCDERGETLAYGAETAQGWLSGLGKPVATWCLWRWMTGGLIDNKRGSTTSPVNSAYSDTETTFWSGQQELRELLSAAV